MADQLNFIYFNNWWKKSLHSRLIHFGIFFKMRFRQKGSEIGSIWHQSGGSFFSNSDVRTNDIFTLKFVTYNDDDDVEGGESNNIYTFLKCAVLFTHLHILSKCVRDLHFYSAFKSRRPPEITRFPLNRHNKRSQFKTVFKYLPNFQTCEQ